MLETERLVLRRWEDSDAGDLFEYAKDPDVGPIAGWPPHQSIEESREVIKNVFTGREAYAVCLKTDGKAIGAIERTAMMSANLASGWGSHSGGRASSRKLRTRCFGMLLRIWE